MGYTKRLVCLANSAKPRGSCIAGIELTSTGYRGWIRPVSARPKAELAWLECLMEGGLMPRPLDIIDIPFLSPAPHHHQVETPRDLLDGACLLCSEEKPHHCHRRLVSEYLQQHWEGIQITHLA